MSPRGLSDVYGMGIVVEGEYRNRDALGRFTKDVDAMAKTVIGADGKARDAMGRFVKMGDEAFHAGSKVQDAIKGLNLSMEGAVLGAWKGIKKAQERIKDNASAAETINSLKRDLLTVGFSAEEAEEIFRKSLDITRQPHILAGWKDLLQVAFDIKGAMGAIGTAEGAGVALDAVATLQSGTPEKNVTEDLKSAWIGFFQGYGKYSQDIQADSLRFVNMMTKVNSEFATTNAKIARGFGPNAILMSNYNQSLESALALTGALNEVMGDKTPAAIEALFRELSQSANKLGSKGIVVTDAQGRALQIVDIIREFQKVLPGLGTEAFDIKKVGAFAQEFQISSDAMMAIQAAAAMLPKIKNVLGGTGTGTEAFEAAMKRAAGNYEKTMLNNANATAYLEYELGEGAIPALQSFTGQVTNATLALAEFVQKHPLLANVGIAGKDVAVEAGKYAVGGSILSWILNRQLGKILGTKAATPTTAATMTTKLATPLKWAGRASMVYTDYQLIKAVHEKGLLDAYDYKLAGLEFKLRSSSPLTPLIELLGGERQLNERNQEQPAQQQTNHITITVNPPAGASTTEIADDVVRRLEAKKDDQAMRWFGAPKSPIGLAGGKIPL